MECQQDKNRQSCNCTYAPCPRKGLCCACLKYHPHMRQLPGCCFSAAAESAYDRSFERFARLVANREV